jgi:hypothetical protein
VIEYNRGHLSTTSVVRPDRDGDCEGLSRQTERYEVLVGPDGLQHLSFDFSGNIIEENSVSVPEFLEHGHAIQDGPRLFYLSYKTVAASPSGSMSWILKGTATGSWATLLNLDGPLPSLAIRGVTVVATTQALDGIVEDSGSGPVESTIEMGHTGLVIHDRDEQAYGWFSVSQDRLYYSIGAPDSLWSTEYTGHEDPSLTPSWDLRASVASHPATGEPHLVYGGFQELISVARVEGEWLITRTPVEVAFSDLKATWVGCGRPGAEASSIYALPGASALGWYIFESR